MLDKIKWFWKYYRKYGYVLAVLLLLTPVQTVFQVSIPRMIEFMVDFVKTSEIPDNAVAVWLTGVGSEAGPAAASAVDSFFFLLPNNLSIKFCTLTPIILLSVSCLYHDCSKSNNECLISPAGLNNIRRIH